MRLRNIPGAKEEIVRNSCVADDPQRFRGNWAAVFDSIEPEPESSYDEDTRIAKPRSFSGDAEFNKEATDAGREGRSPLYIEVGMGKGRFLMEMARLHPGYHYIGIEMYDSVLLRAVQKKEELKRQGIMLANCLFIREDARLLPEIFAPGEVSGIYLNFSDPWPKARHAKRRLTSHQFLERYEKILAPGGRIVFKTDNRELFDFSLLEAAAAGWRVESFTYDLHHEKEMMQGNIMTEYEEKFSAQGKPIGEMILTRDVPAGDTKK